MYIDMRQHDYCMMLVLFNLAPDKSFIQFRRFNRKFDDSLPPANMCKA